MGSPLANFNILRLGYHDTLIILELLEPHLTNIDCYYKLFYFIFELSSLIMMRLKGDPLALFNY